MKLMSQMLSLTSLIPTYCPANTELRLSFCWLKQMRPPRVTVWLKSKEYCLHAGLFLIYTLTYFTIYGNAGIFVLFSGFAMAAWAIAMRFLPFWEPDGGPVSRETALGV